VLRGDRIPATRIQDIKILGLPHDLESNIIQAAYDERMLWELWMESADDYKTLLEQISRRGYVNLTPHPTVRYAANSTNVLHAVKGLKASKQSTRIVSQTIPQRKTMLR
jgi:hypothetical protein